MTMSKDRRIPHLEVGLAYTRVAGISMEVIVDDKLDLTSFNTTAENRGAMKRRQCRKQD